VPANRIAFHRRSYSRVLTKLQSAPSRRALPRSTVPSVAWNSETYADQESLTGPCQSGVPRFGVV